MELFVVLTFCLCIALLGAAVGKPLGWIAIGGSVMVMVVTLLNLRH